MWQLLTAWADGPYGASCLDSPAGLALSPDENTLYIAGLRVLACAWVVGVAGYDFLKQPQVEGCNAATQT